MESLVEYLNISYVPSKPPNNVHSFDLYIPKQHALQPGGHPRSLPALVCFIHGGAWRKEDKLDHAGLARKLVAVTNHAVAVPNYRLSPQDTTDDASALRHPEHAKDVLRFLEFVQAWEGPQGICVYDPSRLCLMGHSCGAHMLSSILLGPSREHSEDALRPSPGLIESTKAIVTSEGIYDIDFLLSNFPAYRAWFIEAAFGQRSSYEAVSVTKMTPRTECRDLQWLIVHSKGDTLVDEAQSEAMYQHLLHNVPHVTKNFEELQEEHNAILNGEEFMRIVGQYILDNIP